MMEGIEEAVRRMQAEADAPLADKLGPAEKAFHDSLVGIAAEYGKFGDKGQGEGKKIFIQYVKPADNEDISKGVKCGNCSFYQGGKNCSIIGESIADGGRCRLITIPEGIVKY